MESMMISLVFNASKEPLDDIVNVIYLVVGIIGSICTVFGVFGTVFRHHILLFLFEVFIAIVLIGYCASWVILGIFGDVSGC